nr:MAG TPA: hypothetical protein [Caudoviricetes sp.]
MMRSFGNTLISAATRWGWDIRMRIMSRWRREKGGNPVDDNTMVTIVIVVYLVTMSFKYWVDRRYK